VGAKSSNGSTALHYAARYGQEGAARVLLDAGVDVAANSSNGLTALHLAAENGHEGVVTMLMGAGADGAAKNDAGKTSLDLAAQEGHAGAARVLRDAERQVPTPPTPRSALGWVLSGSCFAREEALCCRRVNRGSLSPVRSFERRLLATTFSQQNRVKSVPRCSVYNRRVAVLTEAKHTPGFKAIP